MFFLLYQYLPTGGSCYTKHYTEYHIGCPQQTLAALQKAERLQ